MCVLAVGGAQLRAETTPSDSRPRIDIGFDGAYKVGRWTPARVSGLSGAVDSVAITASDPDGRPVAFELTRGDGGGAFSGLFQSGRLDAPLQVRASYGDRVESHIFAPGAGDTLRSCRQSTRFWLLVGSHPGFVAAAQRMNAAASASGDDSEVDVFSRSHASLPTNLDSLEGLDLIVLGPGSLSGAQSEAIRGWVLRGGRLVAAIGSAGESFSQGPLAGWLPVETSAAMPERQTGVLVSRLTAFVPDCPSLHTLEELPVSPLVLKDGVTLVEGPRGPVVTRSVLGLGIVTAVAVDLHRAPFFDEQPMAATDPAIPTTEAIQERVLWAGLPAICRRLAGEDVAAAGSGQAGQPQLAPTGVSDVQSQLGAILDHFPDVQRPSSWNVIGLLGAYLLVIGPLDYLLVHRLLRRPQLTWITLPAWIVLAGWWSTTFAAKANGVAGNSNQLQVLDVAADSGAYRAAAWFSLYSPATRRYTVGAKTVLPGGLDGDAPSRLCWTPRPEEGFRGMYRRGGIDLGTAGYRLEPGDATADQIPVPIWSTLALTAQADTIRPAGPPIAETRMVYDHHGRLVRWDLVHRLPGELTDWFVVQAVQANFPLADAGGMLSLAPDVPCDLTRGCGQQLLKSYIQGESATVEKTKHGEQQYVRSDAYDPLSLDHLRLMRVLSFYKAIGGEGYTGLTNHTLGRLDFSDFIHLDRLVLFGRLSRPVTTFDLDGVPVTPAEPATYVRIVIPIVRETLEFPNP